MYSHYRKHLSLFHLSIIINNLVFFVCFFLAKAEIPPGSPPKEQPNSSRQLNQGGDNIGGILEFIYTSWLLIKMPIITLDANIYNIFWLSLWIFFYSKCKKWRPESKNIHPRRAVVLLSAVRHKTGHRCRKNPSAVFSLAGV